MLAVGCLLDVPVELAGELEHAREAEQALSVIEDVLALIHGCALDDLTGELPDAREPSDDGENSWRTVSHLATLEGLPVHEDEA